MNQQQDPSKVPFSPQMLEGMDWETLNSLAYKFQGEAAAAAPVEPLQQLAMGDGVSMQTHRAMKEAGVGRYDKETAPAAPKEADAWTRGKDDQMTLDWKERNKERQQREYEQLMKKRRG